MDTALRESLTDALNNGLTREQILMVLDETIKSIEESEKEEAVENARGRLIDTLVDYLEVLDPKIVDFTGEQELKFYNDIIKTLKPFEEVLLYGAKTPVKGTKDVDADKVILSFLKKKNLV